MARLLVTGGAGYVGSHCARALAEAGHEVVTLDDLSQGHREAVTGELIEADLRHRDAVVRVLRRGFDAVLHFAARMSVPESLQDPLGYFDVNVGGSLSLLQAMRATGCDALVFSSTCAVYGVPPRVPISEDAPFAPVSPYGETKAAVERLLAHERVAGGLRSVCLRYFNAAGASVDGRLGEAHHPETHLIPLALAAAAADAPLTVHGGDHPTADGTCVRDYVHVEDLARAHLAAVEALLRGEPGGAYNVGTGRGTSVRQILEAVARITGRRPDVRVGPRRPGDPSELVADARRAARELGWAPRHDLDAIVAHAWGWYRSPAYGPRAPGRDD